MQKLIDELYRFDRRPVYAIYGVPSDFGFACMDKVSIAVDLGFQSRQAGIVTAVAEHPFASVKEVEDFPWHVSLDGAQAQAELEMLRGLKLVQDIELAAVLQLLAKAEEILWFRPKGVPVY